ncbi:glycine cleavage system aminomethyltransferase GcvT [Candidatus Riflebacteria bacterium]
MAKRTPLYSACIELGAKMVDFAGWEMPVKFSSIVEEHMAVRTTAGLFDVSHMGEFEVKGKDALTNVENWICNSVRIKKPGGIVYSPICNNEGNILDDLLVYKFSDEYFLLVVNAANRKKDFQWFQSQLKGDVSLTDQSDAISLIAFQGPEAENILQTFVNYDLTQIKYYRFFQTALLGSKAIISRTGYTGEDGFEIYTDNRYAADIFRQILLKGKDKGVKPVGLGARDSLRLEAGMCLYGQDIDETKNPLQARLDWTVKLKKSSFIGKEAIENFKMGELTPILTGLEMQGKNIARNGHQIIEEGEVVGYVTSGVPAPFLKKNIALAYIPQCLAQIGNRVHVSIRDRDCPASIVKFPFYRRKK